MDYLTAFNYLMENDGSTFIVDGEGNRMIGGTTSYPIDRSYRPVGGRVRRDVKFVRSFDVIVNTQDRSMWSLTVNKKQHIGIYPTQAAALAVLVGLITRCDGGQEASINALFNKMLDEGSRLDSDTNVLSIVNADPELTMRIQNTDYLALEALASSASEYADGIFLAYQTSTDDVNYTTPTIAQIYSPDLSGVGLGGTTERTSAAADYAAVPFETYIRTAVVGLNGLTVTVFASSDPIFKTETGTLTPGSETPGTWSEFSRVADGDGMGLDLTGDTTDTLIGSQPPAARLLTPLYNDSADITEVSLVTHPSSYVKQDGSFQEDPAVYFYCNGNRARGVKDTDPAYGNTVVWKAQLSNVSGQQCEIRAVVVPEKGVPAILQGGWEWNGTNYELDQSARGCMINDYTEVQVGPGQTYETLADAFAAQSVPNIKYVCSGQGNDWDDAFSTTDVMHPPLSAQEVFNPQYSAWPIVTGAKLKIAYDVSTNTRGVIWKNCEIYNWPKPDTTYANRLSPGYEEYWYRANTSTIQWRCNEHDMYIATQDCTVAIKENTSYVRPGGNAAAAQVHVNRGFGTLMHLYDLGKGGNQVGFNQGNVSPMSASIAHYGTTFKFMGSNCDEAVNVTSTCPSADNDIYNANLVINTFAANANKYAYPFGSVLSDAPGIGYNYDYTKATSTASNDNTTVSSAVTAMQNLVDFDGSQTVPNNPPPYASKLTIDAGIWPDMLFSKWREGGDAVSNNVDLTVIFEQGDGSYEDYYGYTYATWPFLWDEGQDPHLDFVQGFSKSPKYIVIANSGLLGWEDNQDYQGIFYRASTVTEAGAWFDLQFTSGPQVKYSVGMENATSPGAMIFGPGMETLGATTSLRDYITASNTDVYVFKNFIGNASEADMDPYTDLGVADTGNVLSSGTAGSGGTVNIVAVDRRSQIGTVTISGSTTPATSGPQAYSVSVSGDSTGLQYSWTCPGATIVNGTTATPSITFPSAQSFTITCTVTSTDPINNDSPQVGTLAVVAEDVAVGDFPENELGVGSIDSFKSSGGQTITYDAQYPQDGNGPIGMQAVNLGSNDNFPGGQFVGTGAQGNTVDWPEYCAVYVPASRLGTNFGQNRVGGWYVFGNKTWNTDRQTIVWDTPEAWPTITSTGSPNDTGFLYTMASTTDEEIHVAFYNTLPTGALGSGEGGTDGWSAPPSGFLTLSDLEAAINGATEGDTIDLQGSHYRPADMAEADSYPLGVAVTKNITLTNGTISGTLDTTWTESATPGIFYTDIPSSTNSNVTYDDPRVYLIDDAQTDAPYLQSRRQDTRDFYKPYNALSKNDTWYDLSGVEGSRTLVGDNAVSITAGIGVKAQWDSYFAGGAAGTSTIFLGTPNLVSAVPNASYDSGTGTLTFSKPTDLDVSSYMFVTFSGLDPDTFLEPGEYCFRGGEGRIYYRPVNGSAAEARVPAMTKLLRITTNQKTLTLDNCTVFGTLEGADSSAGVVSSSTSGATAGVLATRNGTTMRHCAAAVIGCKIDLQDSTFDQFTKRGGSGVSSGQVLRNYFGNSANQSPLYFGYSSTADPILVRDNIFNLPASAHGQPISLYKGSWQNATVDHNIFYNCQRILSFQPDSQTDLGDPTQIGSFNFTNNLAYVDEIRDTPVTSGQAGFAFNGAPASNLEGLGQEVNINSNSFILADSLLTDQATNNVAQAQRLDIGKVYYLESVSANNIIPSRAVGTASNYALSTEPGLGSLGNAHYGTAITTRGLAASDIQSNGYSGNFNTSTLVPSGNWSTGATDGGAVGIRWSSVPAASAIATLDRTWAATYPAQTIPSVSFPASADDIIVAGDDKRVVPAYGIPNISSPTTDNAYYRSKDGVYGIWDLPTTWGPDIEVRNYTTARAWGLFLLVGAGNGTILQDWFAANGSASVRFEYSMTSDGTGDWAPMNGRSGVYTIPVSSWTNTASTSPRTIAWGSLTPDSGDAWLFPLPTGSSVGTLPTEMTYNITIV